MSVYDYYALHCLSQEAIDKAIELKMNQDSYMFKSLSDPRRACVYLILIVDKADGYISYSRHILEDDLSYFTLEGQRVNFTAIID